MITSVSVFYIIITKDYVIYEQYQLEKGSGMEKNDLPQSVDELIDGLQRYRHLSEKDQERIDKALTIAKLRYMPHHAEMRRRIAEKYKEYLQNEKAHPKDEQCKFMSGVFRRYNRISNSKMFPVVFSDKRCIKMGAAFEFQTLMWKFLGYEEKEAIDLTLGEMKEEEINMAKSIKKDPRILLKAYEEYLKETEGNE